MNIRLSKGMRHTEGNTSCTIVDEDRLCFLVLNEGRGDSKGIRTISKQLLGEFIVYLKEHPDANAADARDALTGTSDLDRFEYGYNSTLFTLAKLALKNGTLTDEQSQVPTANEIIFYGSPGTGKSFRVNELTRGQRVVRITFHPDTDYAAFVGSYKPSMEKEKGSADSSRIYSQTELINILTQMRNDGQGYAVQRFGAIYWRSLETMSTQERTDLVLTCGFKESMAVELPKGMAAGKCLADKDEGGKGGRIVYKFVGQAFCKAYVQAWKLWAQNPDHPERQYLVIEEINRGNCAQIFGDLFQLLDRNARGFSEYPVEADEDLGRQLQEDFAAVSFRQPRGMDLDRLLNCPPSTEQEGGSTVLAKVKRGEWLLLPPNLFIWATMNTSDQSLFPIDSAFKRRWEWEYAPLCDAGMKWQIRVGENSWDWWQFLQRVNEEIGSLTLSEDKKLGYFFVHPQDGVVDERLLVGKVIFYLWNDVLKDYEESSFFKDGQGGRLTFDRFYLPASRPGEARVNEQAVMQFMENVVKN